MKAIVRNILLACLVSGFALFGVLGRRIGSVPGPMHSSLDKPLFTELQKENLICISIALLIWLLCIWRCAVLHRRMKEQCIYQRRFHDYMRASALNRQF